MRITELDQFILLTLLALEQDAPALDLRQRLTGTLRRPVGRGALYRALDRLERAGAIRARIEAAGPERGGQPRRLYRVTRRGVAALRESRALLLSLWAGYEDVLE